LQDIIGLIRKIYRLGIKIVDIVEPETWTDRKILGAKEKSLGRTNNLYLKLEYIALILTPGAN